MKRDSASVYVHMRRDIQLPLYTAMHILDDPPLSLVAYVLDGWPPSCVYIIAQSRIIDIVYLINWSHKVMWNSHFLSKLQSRTIYLEQNSQIQ